MNICLTCGTQTTNLKFCSRKCNKPSSSSRKPRMAIDVFIAKANEMHNFKYDYSKVATDTVLKEKVIIICPIHKEFHQSKGDHLNSKCGCPRCARELTNKNGFNYELIKENNIRKYGAPNVAQVNFIFDKIQNNNKIQRTNKIYTFPSGNSYNVQGYEPKVLDWLLSIGQTEENIMLKNRPSIKYFWNSSDGYGDNKFHYYHPDIILIKEHHIIEVKSQWTFDGNGTDFKKLAQNLAKERGAIEAGYSFEFVVL